MDKVIWKFKIDICSVQIVAMPQGAQILSAQKQDGDLCLWALCNPDACIKKRIILIYGTGHSVQYPVGKFIDTIQERMGALVWHVFEAKT